MGFSPIPRYVFRELTDISPNLIKKLGIKLLMLDLDNTVAAYSEHSPSDSIARWITEIKNSDIELFIISNSSRTGRVDSFAKALQIGYITGASKPSPNGVTLTMKKKGFSAKESALVGDQIFTDVLAANRAGVISMIVKPRRFTNPFLAIRYVLEMPLRAMCRNKIRSL